MDLTNSNSTTAPIISEILCNMKFEELAVLSQTNNESNNKNYNKSTSLKAKGKIRRPSHKKLTEFCIQTDSKLKLKIRPNKLKKVEKSIDLKELKEVMEENEKFSQYASSSKYWEEEIKIKISLDNFEKYKKKESLSILMPESGSNIFEHQNRNSINIKVFQKKFLIEFYQK